MTGPLSKIELAPRGIRDIRHLDRSTRKRVQLAFEALAADAANLEIKQIAGHAPWRRLRVGEHRVIYRSTNAAGAADPRYLVARVTDRRDLHRAIDKL